MLTSRQVCIVTIIMCALVSLVGWCVTGHPKGYEPAYICAGVAVGAILSVVGLVAQRRSALLEAVAEPTPEDRDRVALPAGTAAMRRADLARMKVGEISIDEYVDLWSGREVIEERDHEIKLAKVTGKIEALEELRESLKHRIPANADKLTDEQFKEDVRIAIFKEIMRDPKYEAKQPACRKCLGIHETETCTAGGPLEFRTGDKVRTNGAAGTWAGRIATLGMCAEDGRWQAEFGGAQFMLDERAFTHAMPVKGEVWYAKKCAMCETRWSNSWNQGVINVDYNWLECQMTRSRVRCGCLYKMGMQDTKS